MSDLSTSQFTYITDLIRNESGIDLNPNKGYLVNSRLTPVARAEGYDDIATFVQAVQAGRCNAQDKIIDALTTNETSFFRDQKPFTALKNTILPRILTNMQPNETLNIWSAACSSGQEPFSIAMSLLEERSLMEDMQFSITATDISPDMIERAKKATYSQFEVQRGMPITLLMKYLTQDGERWQIKEELTKNITFSLHNLMQAPPHGQFDIVFCRNVLIYFDQATKTQVLERLAQSLKKECFLVLGSTETIMGLTDAFQPVEQSPGVFTKA